MLVVCSASLAGAEPPPPPASHLALSGHLGFNGPFSILGGELEYAPLPNLAVAAGGGTNRGLTAQFGGASSYSIAGAVRGRWPVNTRWTAVLGVGGSTSDWHTEDHPLGESPYADASWRRVWWLDIDLGMAVRAGRVVVRFYIGHSGVLAKHGYHCDDLRGDVVCPYQMYEPSGATYAGVAVGWAFGV